MGFEEDKGNKRFFYLTARVPINGVLKNFIGIFQEGNYEVHIFTEYFTDRIGNFTLKNKAFNTIKNFHLTYIIRFLNFIFNDSRNKIDRIEELTLDIVEEFLDKYSMGSLPNDSSGEWKSKKLVSRATYSISHFVYWLYWKKDKNTNKKKFKMKYLKESDFQFETKKVYSKNGYSSKDVKRLIDIVIPNTINSEKVRSKVVTAGNYSIRKLIELSEENDPMLTLGIVLGAYCGLRVGDIVQLHEGRIKELYEGKTFGAYFEFNSEEILRSDNIITGNIKTKRIVPIYPGCSEIVFKYYKKHINYLKLNGLYPNKYSAVFMNNRGKAMTYKTYLKRFGILCNLLDVAMKREVLHGSKEAIRECQILDCNKITPHSLRHYFKQLIESVEKNPRIIQYYMAHKSLESQNSYAFALSTKEGIRECQKQLYAPLKK